MRVALCAWRSRYARVTRQAARWRRSRGDGQVLSTLLKILQKFGSWIDSSNQQITGPVVAGDEL